MDCPRRVSWPARALGRVLGPPVTAAVLGLGLGCVHESKVLLTEPPKGEVQITAAADLPERTPHASTCVAFGDLQMRAARDADKTPADRERLYEKARKAYKQALKLDPKCLAAYRGLARTYEAMGERERMVATYREAMKAYPKDETLPYDLGMAYARNKEWGPAVECFKAAADMDPENHPHANMLAYCLARAGRYDESLAIFKRTDGEARAHYNLARMLRHVHDDAGCKQQLRLALQADPELADARKLQVELDGAGPAPAHATAQVGFESID